MFVRIGCCSSKVTIPYVYKLLNISLDYCKDFTFRWVDAQRSANRLYIRFLMFGNSEQIEASSTLAEMVVKFNPVSLKNLVLPQNYEAVLSGVVSRSQYIELS